MSKINNSGLDQYGKAYSLNGIGGERVKCYQKSRDTNWYLNWSHFVRMKDDIFGYISVAEVPR